MHNTPYFCHCEAAQQPWQSRNRNTFSDWIASSSMLLAMTGMVITILCTAGCSSDAGTKLAKQNAEQRFVLYSPNGEPLNGGILGHPSCETAMTTWFNRVDTNHDGFADKSEFMADAHVQFSLMDIDRNGYLVSEELERYRMPYRTDRTQKPIHHSLQGPQQRIHGKSDEVSASDLISQTNLIDPVMSADTNLDFKVTLAEFLAQSAKNFGDLDNQHSGRISRTDVLKLCSKDNKPSE